MQSARLQYEPYAAGHAATLLELARDAHVRRWLLDDAIVPDDWPDAVLEVVEAMRVNDGLDFFLAFHDGAPIGFCGFFVFDSNDPEPQLLYALLPAHAGRGLATEMAETMLESARVAQRSAVHAAVDAPNVASIRVLEKLGFERTGERPGPSGATVHFRRAIA